MYICECEGSTSYRPDSAGPCPTCAARDAAWAEEQAAAICDVACAATAKAKEAQP